MMNLRRLSVLAVAALALAACGEESSDDAAGTNGTTETEAAEPAPTGKSTQTIKVVETEFALSPQNPKVDKAGVVTFDVKNDGKVVHALEVEGPKGEVETEEIQPAESAKLKVDLGKAGRFEWYCPIGNHKDQGMKGEIVVAGGGSGKADDKGGATGGGGNGGYSY